MRKNSGGGAVVRVRGGQGVHTHGKGINLHVELSGSSCQGVASLSGSHQVPCCGAPSDFLAFSFFYFLTWEQGVGEKEGRTAGVCVCVCAHSEDMGATLWTAGGITIHPVIQASHTSQKRGAQP